MSCRLRLIQEGKPSPRQCQECGLFGKCRYGLDDVTQLSPTERESPLSRIKAALVCGDPLPHPLTRDEAIFLEGWNYQRERPWMIPGVTYVDPNYKEMTPGDLDALADTYDSPDEEETNEPNF